MEKVRKIEFLQLAENKQKCRRSNMIENEKIYKRKSPNSLYEVSARIRTSYGLCWLPYEAHYFGPERGRPDRITQAANFIIYSVYQT